MESRNLHLSFHEEPGTLTHKTKKSYNLTIPTNIDDFKQREFLVYDVINSPDKVCFWVLGCNGTPLDYANAAKAINELAQMHEIDFGVDLGDRLYPNGFSTFDDPAFETFLTAYNDDALFGKPILCTSGNHEAGRLNTVKSVLGWTGPESTIHDQVEYNQVSYAFLPHKTDPENFLTQTKLEFYSQTSLDYKNLPKIVMPALAYSMIFNQLQLFIINSNNIVKDFYELIKLIVLEATNIQDNSTFEKLDFIGLLTKFIQEEKIPLSNQLAGFFKAFREAKAAGRTIIICQHHPLDPLGKRFYQSDAHLYIRDSEMQKVSLFLDLLETQHCSMSFVSVDIQGEDSEDNVTYTTSVNDLLKSFKDILENPIKKNRLSTNYDNYNLTIKRIYMSLGIICDLLVAAHEHNFSYYNNKEDEISNENNKEKELEKNEDKKQEPTYGQLISGANDSESHEITNFTNWKYIGAFTKDITTVLLTADTKNPNNKITADVYIQDKTNDTEIKPSVQHLKFFNTSSKPIQQIPAPNYKLKSGKTLQKAILEGCQEYLEFLKVKQGTNGRFFINNRDHKSTAEVSKIMNFVNQFEFDETNSDMKQQLDALIESIVNKDSDNSLYKKIKKSRDSFEEELRKSEQTLTIDL